MPNHGGARPGAGAKPRSATPATVNVHLRLTPDERTEVDDDLRPNETVGGLARDLLLREIRRRANRRKKRP
jgi:hypothetical protein